MNRWLRAHWKACRLALARLAAAPLNTLLAIVGIGIALALPAGGQWLVAEAGALTQGAAATPQLSLFLPLESGRDALPALEAKLRARPEVARVEVHAREATLKRMQRDARLAEAIAALPGNPFPDALVVTPADSQPERIEALAAELRQWREIEHVQIDSDWAQRLAALVRLARTSLILLAVLLGVGLVAITFNTIRLQALTRQAEIEVSALLGATAAFIRRPFLWHGSLLGLAGGGVAWLIVAAGSAWLRAPLAELATLYGTRIEIALPGWAPSALLLGVATLLGWAGAALSLREHLRA